MNTLTEKIIKLENNFEKDTKFNNLETEIDNKIIENVLKKFNINESSLFGEKSVSIITSSLTSLNSDKFDDGWIDSGVIISFSDALKKLK